MEREKICVVKKETAKGEDGYKVFSVRIKEKTVCALDRFACESNRSRNELINILLEYGVTHYEVVK